jgi:3',5'-cyclic AMP phosphodiesterase CpdA
MDASDLPSQRPAGLGTAARATIERGPREWTFRRTFVIALTLLLIGAAAGVGVHAWAPVGASSQAEQPSATSFSFGAAGDYAFGPEAHKVMASMGQSGLDFVLALGDFSYEDATEAEWCNYFEGRVGDGKVLLIAGNHDESHIDMFAQHCNFDIDAPRAGVYAKEYYFDYPRSSPLARFILSSCGLDLDGVSWDCAFGDTHYNFLSNAIDDARAKKIPWIITGMHKNCISNGDKDCSIGEAVQDLLLDKKVDLVLQGHEHAYLRSHPLLCANDDEFRPECLAPTGEWGQILAIVGSGGRGNEALGGMPDEPYFATWDGDTFGFLKVILSATSLKGTFVPVNGTYTDSFTISRAPTEAPSFTLSASSSSLDLATNQAGDVTVGVEGNPSFTGTVSLQVSAPTAVAGSCDPPSLRSGETSRCTLVGGTPGSYSVTITGTGGSIVRSRMISLSIYDPPPGPDSTPPLITISWPANASVLSSGDVTVTGRASDDRGLQKVELSLDGVNWISASGTDPWSGSLTLPAGDHWIRARATDDANNDKTVVIQVFVDTDLPEAPSRVLGLPWPEWAVVSALALAAALVGGAIAWLAKRARRGGPPAR